MPDSLTQGLVSSIARLQLLPNDDKEILIEAARIGYGHAEEALQRLSIFSRLPTPGRIGDIEFTLITGEEIYYAGLNLKSNLGVFLDHEKKLLYGSRFYLSHLASFINNIDACLFHAHRLSLDDHLDVGKGFCAIEKWFPTYGHYKDEVFTLSDFISRLPSCWELRAFLDYPIDAGLNTPSFTFNPNYQSIDALVFGSTSFNSYSSQGTVLRLSDLFCLRNRFTSKCFHSFPKDVTSRIRSQLSVPIQNPIPSKIFVTRSKSYRDIANKSQVEEYMVNEGFVLANPEQLSYQELVCMLSHAECAVFYYGSALTNMVYLPPKSRVFILKSQSYMSENISLWSKLISSYELHVSEIKADTNVIEIENLRSFFSNPI
jgi:hypothetical protein